MNELENEMHNDPKNWKFGVFYFNPKDDRLFLPKRFPPSLSITVNFANNKVHFVIMSLVILIMLAFLSQVKS